MTTWRATLVRFLAARVLRAPRITVGCALALAILSVLYTAANLQFKTDRTDVVSAARRERRLAQERIRQFGDRDGFVVAIENRDRAESIAFLKALAGRIEQDTASFEDVFSRIDPKMFAHGVLLYVDPDGLKSLREKLLEHRGFIGGLAASPDLPTFFRLVNQRITSGLVGGLFTGFLEQEQAAGSPPPGPGLPRGHPAPGERLAGREPLLHLAVGCLSGRRGAGPLARRLPVDR